MIAACEVKFEKERERERERQEVKLLTERERGGGGGGGWFYITNKERGTNYPVHQDREREVD